MNRRIKTTWSVDNIKVKDNFYDYVMILSAAFSAFSNHHHN